MPDVFVAKLDSRAQDRYLRKFTPDAVERAMSEAAKFGANAARDVMKDAAPIGTSERPSQYYRAHGLPHGTFRAAVKAAKIRGRRAAISIQGGTVGYVIGPMGKNGFTRFWRERDTHWTAKVAGRALDRARDRSEAFLREYGRG